MQEKTANHWSRKKLAAALLVVTALVALVLAARHSLDDGPTYEGKPLRYWVERLNVDASSDPHAERVIASAGVEAVPFLIKLETEPDSFLARCRAKIAGFIPALDPVLPRSTPISDKAYVAFRHLGPKCIPPLVDNYNSGDERIRIQAVHALHDYAMVSPQALEAILRAARDESDEVRIIAALTLAQFIPLLEKSKQTIVPEPVFLSLADLAVDRANVVPGIAVHTLRKFGLTASPAIPRLLDHLKSNKEGVRRAATNALQAIDPDYFK